MNGGKDQSASVAGIRLTHPDRVLYPQQGLTKRDLADYLEKVSEPMLAHLSGRLLGLVRCPEGRARQCFFQRHPGAGMPGEIKRRRVKGKHEEEEYLYIDDTKGLIAAAQMGVLEFHIWGSHVDKVERPDRIVFDLDPDPRIGFEAVKTGARRLRETLEALDLKSFPLLTGGKGIHVVVPVVRRHGWDTIKSFAEGLATRIAEDDPDHYVTTMSKAKRRGRIFIDYFRNDRANMAIAPYSPRARKGAPVAWPLTWQSLGKVRNANEVGIAEASRRLRNDPWSLYGEVRQSLTRAALRAVGAE